MRKLWFALPAAVAPAPALAHDAFGDLGPFYASLLHPLADPVQAVLILGTAALLAGRALGTVRVALPLFVAAAALSHVVLGWRGGLLPSPALVAGSAVAVGIAATIPDRWTCVPAVVALVAVTGALVGLLPDRPPPGGALQPILGTVAGVIVLTTLTWAALDALTRRVSWLAPAVAGSWVAAVGLIVGALALAPPQSGVASARATPPAVEGSSP
jgi:hypothetical protein